MTLFSSPCFYLDLAACIAGLLALCGLAQSLLGAHLLSLFVRREKKIDRALAGQDRDWPPISVMKPLHGVEEGLAEALETLFAQDYPDFEVIFGVQDPEDPAIELVLGLQARHPERRIGLVIDQTSHGINRKIGNLINMQQEARHDILVLADSDMYVSPYYLKHLAIALESENAGMVTTLYAALPVKNLLPRLFEAQSINCNFLPGVLLSRKLGRSDALGATMAFRAGMLAEAGGLQSLANYVADDARLGERIRQIGKKVVLASTLTRTTVREKNFRDLFHHELRWGRTTRSVAPVGYGFSALQLSLFWASLAVLFLPASLAAWGLFLGSWTVRAGSSISLWRRAGLRFPLRLLPFLPLRDWMSIAVILASFGGSRVIWRGQFMEISPMEEDRKVSCPSSLS